MEVDEIWSRSNKAIGAIFATAPTFNIVGDKKSLFEDKIAISPAMLYSDENKREWLKTTRNYPISKAFEMKHFLPLAESAQNQTVTEAHVKSLRSTDYCMDTEPSKLSRDLWGYLNLRLTCEKGSIQQRRAKDWFRGLATGSGAHRTQE